MAAPTIAAEAIVNDDGTLTTGTVWNAAFQADFEAKINALAAALWAGPTPTAWTPTLGGSGGQTGQVYGLNTGRYLQIGKLVFVYGQISLSTLGTITGNVQIQGLPVAAANTQFGGLHMQLFQTLTTAYASIGL